MAADTTFTLTFKTIADATGLTAIKSGIQSVQETAQRTAATLNSALSLVGLGLGIQQLNQLGQKALDVREQMAAWTLQILRGRDGSQQLVQELTELNEKLEQNTGTTQATSRAIEQLFSRAGASGQQIKSLTNGVIEFAASSAGTVQPLELATILARRLAGASNETDISLGRLGIRAKDITGIIAELNQRGGNTAEIMAQASGGMKQFDADAEHAKIALGDLVNLFRIPFLTGFTEGLVGAKKNIDDLTKSWSQWGENIWVSTKVLADAIGGMFGRGKLLAEDFALKTKAVGIDALTSVVDATNSVLTAIQKTINAAITAFGVLEKAALGVKNALSFGLSGDDTSVIDKQTASWQAAIAAGISSVKSSLTDYKNERLDELKKTQDEIEKTLQDMIARGPSALSPEGLAKLRAQYQNFINSLKNIGQGVTPGSGVVDNTGISAQKAATNALTQAKYQLAQAEETYKTELERVKLLEDTGAITGLQADEKRRQAAEQYLQTLRQIDAEMPRLIAQQQAVGNVKGVEELRLEWQRVHLEQLKTLDDISRSTLWGKIGLQIRTLANQWADLGKQVGGFLTQQFQNFASTAGNAIGGLVTHTTNWKQAIAQLVQSFVSGLATMVIQWVLARTVLSALNKAFGSADAATANAQASSASAAWSPAAVSASIATYGVAAATGLAAYVSALGIGTAAATASAGVGGAGFESGGFTGYGRDGEPAGIVHRNEVVFPAPRVSALGKDWLVNLAVGSLSRPGYQAGGFVGSSGSTRASGGQQSVEHHHFIFVDDFGAAVRAYNASTAGRKDFQRIKFRNRLS